MGGRCYSPPRSEPLGVSLGWQVHDVIELVDKVEKSFPRPCRALRCSLAVLVLVQGYLQIRQPVKKFIKSCEDIAPVRG